MTSPILLPKRRGVKVDQPRMLDWGGALVPPLGGEVQRLDRLGTRHAIQITLPLMRSEPDGRQWSALLRLAKIKGAMVAFGQDGLKVGLPGSPLVDGAGQLGSSLALKNFRPGYCMRLGQAFSLICSGRRYLYFAAEDTVAGNDGRMALPLFPMLRKSPANNDIAEVEQPHLEGSLSGNELAWTRLAAPFCDFGQITITEDA